MLLREQTARCPAGKTHPRQAAGARPSRLRGWQASRLPRKVPFIDVAPEVTEEVPPYARDSPSAATRETDARPHRPVRVKRGVRRAGPSPARASWGIRNLNVNGSAIAPGHPLGGSGARLATTLIHQTARTGAARGLASLCVG